MTPHLPFRILCLPALLLLCTGALRSSGQVVINEIHYHPVEEAAFDDQGAPVLDLSQDVHEFIELYNASQQPANLTGWRLDGAVEFNLPFNTIIPPDGYLIIAANPQRLAAIPQYNPAPAPPIGPYTGRLSNGDGETVRLRNGQGTVVDAVSYSSTFPWPTSADALGASERWIGIDRMAHQYRGRSLERISAAHPGNDSANWLASTFPGDPTPGRVNSVSQRDPLPIVIAHQIGQASNGAFPIASNQPARIEVTFSSAAGVSAARLEYYVDEINRTDESTTTVAMDGSEGAYQATLPGFPGRTMIRYRIHALRSGPRFSADEQVFPRSDDAFAWSGFFVLPSRNATNDVYDLLISTNSLAQLGRNLSDNPVVGWLPRLGTPPIGRWNLTEPAVLAHGGQLYDVEIRHSGSFYRRDFSRNSYKVEFPSSRKLNGHSTLLILDKGTENIFGHKLFETFGFPGCRVRPVDLYVNNQPRLVRLEFEEHDQDMLDRWAGEQAALYPDQPGPGTGHLYKSSGIGQDLGPFGLANGTPMPANEGWPSLQRYEWVYSSKNRDWEGYVPLKQMIDELWAARGPLPGVDIPRLRTYLAEKWDLNRLIDYVALRAWMSVGDDAYHNYMIWKGSNERWQMVAWDFDGEIGDIPRSIFAGENGNYFKDCVFKAYREEFKQRLWWLNNTDLHPDNLPAIGLVHPNLVVYAPERMKSINNQTFGTFHRPGRPLPIFPTAGESVIGAAVLRATPYAMSTEQGTPHATTCWQIRIAGGTYRDAVYSITSAVQLTSLPLPTDRMQPGATYYWRAIYHDTNGHPSVPSAEAAFRYGGNFRRFELISLDSEWSFLENGTNIARNWHALDYDDSAWKRGRSILGVATSSISLPSPVVTPLPLGQRVYYLRRKFTLPSNPRDAVLQLRHLVDDGAVVYLNGREAMRVNLASLYPPNSVPASALATRDIVSPVLEQPVNLPTTNLLQGENVIAVQLHQYRDASADLLFGASLSGTLEASTGPVRFNEMLALPGDPAPPWVEIVNPSGDTLLLDGMGLTDDPARPLRYAFPPNTLLGPQGLLRVWFSASLDSPFAARFPIQPTHGGLWLHASDGGGGIVELDHLSHGHQIPGWSVGRVPDGTGAWQLTEPTPDSRNTSARLGTSQALRINEWMASPRSGPDWFEVYNPELLPVAVGGFHFTDNLDNRTNSPIPGLSFLPPWSFTRFFADGSPSLGPLHCDFRLGASGEAIGLFSPSLEPIDQITFDSQVENVSQGRHPDGDVAVRSLPAGGTPGYSNRGDADRDGMPDDWEISHGLASGERDDGQDPDGDGATNGEEFMAGTNPRSPVDVLRVHVVRGEPGTVSVQWTAAPGKIYEVQRADDLGTGSWIPLGLAGPRQAAGIEIKQASLPPGRATAYFRVVLRRG